MTEPPNAVRVPTVLLYTRTDVPHHPSIAPGIRALQELAAANSLELIHTEDPSVFTQRSGSTSLPPARPDVIVFLNTACDELDEGQREGLVRCVRGGSGFVGIHSASYFEKDWPWYEALVGARFAGHPEPQAGYLDIIDGDHPATRGISSRWDRFDEWYNFRALPVGLRVLATLDETTYAGGAHGAHHPVIWSHIFEGSRSFYTALGHTEECFRDAQYLRHILGAVLWSAGIDG